MASSSRTIPHLLEPYLLAGSDSEQDLDSELVIATSVLGPSTNWLILRYLYTFLKQTSTGPRRTRNLNIEQDDQADIATAETTSVVLVSFMRDFTFWKENAGRIGLDLDALARAGRFAYVDGLGVDLFHGSSASASGSFSSEVKGVGAGAGAGAVNARGLGAGGAGGIPGRMPGSGLSPGSGSARPHPAVLGRQSPGAAAGAGAGPIPLRGGPVPGVGVGGRIPTAPSPSTATATATAPSPATGGVSLLTNPTISHLRSVISSAIEKVSSGTTSSSGTKPNNNKVILIIDQLDFLLAAASSSAGGPGSTTNDEISTQHLHDLLLDLRETTSSTILTLSADQPLIEIDPPSTTLEKDHANFVLSLLHEANLVLSLRLLDTGVAKDVSGVIRITAGGGGSGRTGTGTGTGIGTAGVEENEYLYHVRGDGSVRVFERGQ
ncbi:hypothetical protein V8F20_000847 [Naviculisporaceae sp. PSN 640]